MEETSALLANLVQTKSIERVLAPIAAQVSQLIIVNEAYEQGDADAFPSDLVSRAETVLVSSDGLVEVANRLCEGFSDDELQVQLPRACDLLSIAGNNLVTAAHRVDAEKFSPESRRHLVRMAKDVLEGTLKVLLVSDDAGVRRIKQAAKWVTERLGFLTVVKTMKHLLPTFKSFTDAMMVLTDLADKRQRDLTNPRQREHILSAMATMKKSVPILSTALQTYVKYPQNVTTESSKDFVVGQLLEAVNQIMEVIENKSIKDPEDMEEPGHFVTKIDQLMERLSEESRLEFATVGTDFDSVMEATVRHCMAVAHLSTETHRQLIIKNCQRVLQQRNAVSDEAKNLLKSPEVVEFSEEFDDSCERLIDEVQDLERHINASILELYVDVFKETTEPLDRLVRAALDANTTVDASNDAAVNPYIETFHTHSDLMTQVARFVAASSSDTSRVREILGCVSHMELLDPEIVPSVKACVNSQDDQATLENLRLLKNEWCSNMDLLIDTLDSLTDPNMFIAISELELKEQVIECKRSLGMSTTDVLIGTRGIIGLARRLVNMAYKVVDKSSDPLYRNPLKAYITYIRKVITAIKTSTRTVLESPESSDKHKKLHDCCDLLLNYVSKVRGALEGDNLQSLLNDAHNNISELCLDDKHKVSDEEKLDETIESEQEDITEQPVDVESKQRVVALKSYIAELTDSRLKELSQGLILAALSGQQTKMDEKAASILSWSNHVVQCSDLLITVQSPNKLLLESLRSEVTHLTPQVLELSSKVLQCDVEQIEPLHQVADQWDRHVGTLQLEIDKIIIKWQEISDKVIDAAKLRNGKLLTRQIQYLEKYQDALSHIVKDAGEWIKHDVKGRDKYLYVRDLNLELERLTSQFGAFATSTCASGNEADKIKLERLGREWSCKFHCTITVMDQKACQATEMVTGCPTGYPWRNITELDKHNARVTDETIRIKSLAQAAFSGKMGEIKRIEELLKELDLMLADIGEVSLGVHQGIQLQTIEAKMTIHRLCLKLGFWASKAAVINGVIDDQLLNISLPLHKTASECHDGMVRFQKKVIDNLSKIYDIDTKASIRRLLAEIEDFTQKITDSSGDEEALILRWQRQILCNIQLILSKLEATIDSSQVEEIQRVLQMRSCDTRMKSPEPAPATKSPAVDRPVANKTTSPALTEPKITAKSLESAPARQPSSRQIYEDAMRGTIALHKTPDRPSPISGFRKPRNSLLSTPVAKFDFDTDKWEDENNPIVKIARDMSAQMRALLDYLRAAGPLQGKGDLINAARTIAENANEMVKFAKILAEYCLDQRCAKSLWSHADHIPTMAVQLSILTSVKAATPEDRTAEKMIVKSAETLMQGVSKMLTAAEAVCIKGFRQPDEASPESQAILLASQWKRKLDRHRQFESCSPDVDSLGLRKVDRQYKKPGFNQILNVTP